MHIMVDCDGVVYDFSSNFNAWAGQSGHKADKWDFYTDWGWTTEQFVKELNAFGADGGFADDIPIDGTQEAIRRLLEAGHRVTFVTDIPPTAEADRGWWIDFYFPGCEYIVSRDKTSFIDEQSIGEFWGIDDRVENVQHLRENNVKGYLLSYPWNDFDTELPRVKTLDEFVDLVLQ